MMTSTSNRHAGHTDDPIFDNGHSRGVATLIVQDYPSLMENCWDDELLPSGD